MCSDVSPRKTKKQKLDNSSSPIKTTLTKTVDSCQFKQSSDSPLLKSNGVTAVYAKMVTTSGLPKKSSSKSKYKKSKTSSKKVNKPKLIRVVDIGSVDLSQVITLQLVFSPAPWVRSVGYTLLLITIR